MSPCLLSALLSTCFSNSVMFPAVDLLGLLPPSKLQRDPKESVYLFTLHMSFRPALGLSRVLSASPESQSCSSLPDSFPQGPSSDCSAALFSSLWTGPCVLCLLLGSRVNIDFLNDWAWKEGEACLRGSAHSEDIQYIPVE